jgi:hypothetical protein
MGSHPWRFDSSRPHCQNSDSSFSRESPMAKPKVRVWHPDFRYYLELVGIECTKKQDIHTLIDVCWSQDLRTCPHEVHGNTLVIPKEATQFLPLSKISHKLVEMRHTISLPPAITRELARRFSHYKEPNYYRYGKGSQATCCRYLVLLSTVEAIEKESAIDLS